MDSKHHKSADVVFKLQQVAPRIKLRLTLCGRDLIDAGIVLEHNKHVAPGQSRTIANRPEDDVPIYAL